MKIKFRENFVMASARVACLNLLVVALISIFAMPALAFEFGSGELEGGFDTTLSYGASWRVSERDPAIIGTANGGTAYSVNGDDGNLNYDKGDLISNIVKITSDLDMQYRNFGIFLRGTAFYDFENNDGTRARTPLSDAALDLVGTDAELLDAYASWNFSIADMPGQIRAGNQVISWGESTFIQNGINAINPINVNKFRLPGAELKEALVPVGLVSASISTTDNISFEGFYQYDWEATTIDAPGTYWSTNDFAGDGGSKIMLGWGDLPDSLNPGDPVPPFLQPVGFAVPRAQTVEAGDDGQYGLNMRIYVPSLNDTEFGFYFMNYHSRVPIISANSGTIAGVGAGDYAASASYFTEYPEDIKLYGVSFNTLLASTGTALQGEYSYRQDVPLQVDDIELLFAALGPIDPAGMGTYNQLTTYRGVTYGFDTEVSGYERMDVSQGQMTGTQVFGPTFGADQFVLVGEAGLSYVHDMPDKDELRFQSAATYVSGNPILGAGHPGKPIEPDSAFADQTSWGYRLISKMDFNNAIGAVTLSPRVAWAHDVSGNSPGPGGSFLEGRKAVSLGLGVNYQHTWTADLSYTNFFGAGRYNLINDRDFVAMNIKYSF